MSSARCVKLLLLVTLIPLALRAASLLLGGAAVPAPSHHRQSATRRSRGAGDATATATATAAVRASVSAGLVPGRRPDRQTRRQRRTEGALAASDGARRLRQAGGGGGWFEDDKRLAPTGSNPLHNLR